MKRLLLDGKELMYAEERARIVAEAKPWVLSMQHAPILRLAFIRELAGIARLQAEDIERQYGLAQPVTSRPFPDGGWQKGRSGFNRRGDGRFPIGRQGRLPNRVFASRTSGSACCSASFPILIW